MVSPKRQAELEEIANLEQFINKNVKEEKESKELFNKEDIEIKTDISEEETSIIARLKYLGDTLELKGFNDVIRYLLELRLSKGRKSRKEFIDSLKRTEGFSPNMNGNNNMGGFANGRF